jgi:membrane protein DedA with SNARE-associated domain
LIPIGLAVTLWYATLTVIGAQLGTQWDRVIGLLNRLNNTLAIVAVGTLALVVGGILWWKHRQSGA